MQQATILDRAVTANPDLTRIWQAWPALDLPEAWLVAGALAQTSWNLRFGLPPGHGISDIDLIYFDPTDLTEDAEQRHATRIRALFPELAVWIDVKNEARVHLWYEAKFGFPIAPYASATAAIDTFPTTATSIGLRPAPGGSQIYAPFGLQDLTQGIVRPNTRLITEPIYAAKVAKWRKFWPGLTILPWDAPASV